MTAAPPTIEEWARLPAEQQPDWRSHPAHGRVRTKLAEAPALVFPEELRALRAGLAEVAAGRAVALQAGDCAESFYESTAEHVAGKLAALESLATHFADRAGIPVLRIGRLGGQFGKPRSAPTESVDGEDLLAFHGHLVNSEIPSPAGRRPDPRRLLWGYQFASEAQRAMRRLRETGEPVAESINPGPWSSHDALVLDYEGPLVRTDEATGDRYLASTHLPWLGARTADLAGAHVALLSTIVNPVAVKVSTRMTPAALIALCAALDPERVPGRLTLIPRMGATTIAAALPPLVRAVRSAGHPVVWLSDPMHGNTIRTASGRKTRYLDAMVAEASAFNVLLSAHGSHPGGLHLETAAEAVTECVGGSVGSERELADNYTSLCDPRLTSDQAIALIDRVAVEPKE
ncbi:3-deoxy-D-arabinoheptulosonate-7-phosphate synthase [Tamaricihabitans halophyticus]|uniref:Phospho-2-dehydro-3-deoxyheptonate aldolase n=1 Tax=Tamaricihabitans halophyticus TaxID=1262583 RepID=A0A4V2SU70_9PSEU|nr:3-deoxy-7-phosphoheptulonate synthase [Tamaricihabitans halophyticus]TCP53436.1 3-deoxy-D-arabinoheptulosonate-7-phosphate synthase [Tamaricihabitans halophyticus]